MHFVGLEETRGTRQSASQPFLLSADKHDGAGKLPCSKPFRTAFMMGIQCQPATLDQARCDHGGVTHVLRQHHDMYYESFHIKSHRGNGPIPPLPTATHRCRSLDPRSFTGPRTVGGVFSCCRRVTGMGVLSLGISLSPKVNSSSTWGGGLTFVKIFGGS